MDLASEISQDIRYPDNPVSTHSRQENNDNSDRKPKRQPQTYRKRNTQTYRIRNTQTKRQSYRKKKRHTVSLFMNILLTFEARTFFSKS